MADDIVTRLRELLDGPVPFVVGREDVRDTLEEIERLQGDIRDMDRRIVTLIGEYQVLCIRYAAEEARRG